MFMVTQARLDTTLECINPNTGHGIGDGDARQTATAIVFAKTFISTTCVLNGRKVMTQILQRLEKMQI